MRAAIERASQVSPLNEEDIQMISMIVDDSYEELHLLSEFAAEP